MYVLYPRNAQYALKKPETPTRKLVYFCLRQYFTNLFGFDHFYSNYHLLTCTQEISKGHTLENLFVTFSVISVVETFMFEAS